MEGQEGQRTPVPASGGPEHHRGTRRRRPARVPDAKRRRRCRQRHRPGARRPRRQRPTSRAPAAGATGAQGATSRRTSNVVKKAKGPVMTTIDEFYKVGPGPLELAHHRADAHHLRLLPALHQAAGRPARQGHGAQGAPVRQPERHRHGPRHRARRRSPASSARSRPRWNRRSSTSLASNPNQTFPVKLGDKTFNVSLKDIVYDAPKGEFPHPNTMTCKLMAGDTVLLEQEYYSVGGGFIEWKGYEPPKKGAAEVPLRDDGGAAEARRGEQAVDRAGGDGQRGGGLRQERGGDQRLHRQDPHGDGQHRQGRPERAKPARCPGRSS